MNDEKSITAKLTDVISKAAGTVKSAVSHVVDAASDAAQHAMEVNAEKISRIPPAKTGAAQLAGTTNQQIYIPQASDAAAMPMPLIPIAPAPRKQRAQKAAAVKAATKAAKRSPAGKSRSSTGKKSAGKNRNKAVKKTDKKSKR